jgi:hypothetical protein
MYSPEMTELLIMGMPGDDRSQKLDALLDMLDREMQALNHPRGFTAGYVRNPHRSLDPKRQFVIAFVYIAVK